MAKAFSKSPPESPIEAHKVLEDNTSQINTCHIRGEKNFPMNLQ